MKYACFLNGKVGYGRVSTFSGRFLLSVFMISAATSGLLRRDAPIPSDKAHALGQPMLTSIPSTSRHKISAALQAAPASEVPIWATNFPRSARWLLKTMGREEALSSPETKSTVPKASSTRLFVAEILRSISSYHQGGGGLRHFFLVRVGFFWTLQWY